MAATVDRQKTFRDFPKLIRKVRMSSIVAGQLEDVTHGGPANTNPTRIWAEAITPPTAPCAFVLVRDQDQDSATGGTARIRFQAEGGGDLAGMVANVFFEFEQSASGGIGVSGV